MSVLEDLSRWYAAQCNGDREHSYGIRIGTIDNPGWSVEIDLCETLLEDESFHTIEEGINLDDALSWLRCEVREGKFFGYGDLGRLEQILEIFLDWAKSRTDWLSQQSPENQQARSDCEFWEFLHRTLASETCREVGCEERRVQASLQCPRHHFEEITSRPCPFANGHP